MSRYAVVQALAFLGCCIGAGALLGAITTVVRDLIAGS